MSEPGDPREIDRASHPDRVWYFMRALGRSGLPEHFEIGGNTYRLTKSVKHDFFAATGFYADDAGKKVVLKLGRTACFLKLPMRWVGRFLCRREMRFYNKLRDVPNVPRLLGMVGDTGFVHVYIEGRPLTGKRPVPDGFFGALQELLAELHRRGMAYVDTNKPENILLGDDRLPYLIDFQISWDSPLFRRRMQREDLYHILKHKKRLRPDELTEEELRRVNHRSWLIWLHRTVTKPYFFVRRRMFRRLRDAGRLLPEGSK